MHTAAALALEPIGVDLVVDLLAGRPRRPACWHPDYPTADTVDAASMLLAGYEANGTPAPERPVWWLYGIVVDGLVVGDAGFSGPPAPARPVEVAIGYQVLPGYRGRGLATRACALLLELAWAHGADLVRADAEPENVASRAVLRANGFRPAPGGGFVVPAPGREASWTA
jgi:GNAT superfamily N-acetyltransferase